MIIINLYIHTDCIVKEIYITNNYDTKNSKMKDLFIWLLNYYYAIFFPTVLALMLALIGLDPMSYGVPVGRNSQPMASGTGCTSGSSGSWSWAGTAMMGNLVWHTGGTTKWGHQQCTWSSPWLLVALVPNCLHGIGSWHPCWLQCQWPSGSVHLVCQLNFP